jgi:WD40 repeat protein
MNLRYSKIIAHFVCLALFVFPEFLHAEEKPEIFVQMGHSQNVESVAFSPDGRYALSGSFDKTMKLWEVSSGREIRTFQGHTESISSVAFSPDGRYALSGSSDKTLKLWEVSSGREIRTFQGHTDSVISVAFSPDGRYALSGSSDNTMKLWEVSSGREIRTFQGHTRPVSSEAFSPDGRYALSGGWDNTMKLWEVSSGREISTFQGHTIGVNSVAFSPDGRYALSGSFDKTMKLWEVSSGREIRTFQGHTVRGSSVAFSPDGRYALSGSVDCTMKLWEVSSGREIRTFQGHTESISSVAFSPNGKYALSGSSDKTMRLWEVSNGREIRIFQGHAGSLYGVSSVAFSPDGKYALSGSDDKTLKLWELASGNEKSIFHVNSERSVVSSVAFSPDGKYVLAGIWDGTVRLWEVSSGREIRIFQGHASDVYSVAFSPDGRYVLSGSYGTMKLWEVSSGREIRTFQGRTESLYHVAFSPDGKYALFWGGATVIFDVDSGYEIASMVAFTDSEWIVITPEGYFNSSPNGAKHLNVRIGNNVYGVDQFYAKFYRPELVQMALAGKELPKGESLGDVLANKNAPTILIVFPQSGVTVDKDSVTVNLKITDNGGGGVGSVNIYRNGSQVANDTRGVIVKGKESITEKSLSFNISLMDGENEIKAVAMNLEGSMESTPAVITVISKAVMQKPNLYALVIGINEYKNKSISLSYAVPDALAFAGTLRKTAGPLFAKIDIKTLTTAEDTTKDAVNRAFADLRSKVRPNDLFVFYDASHGVVDVVDNEEQYFLLTSNVLLLSSRHIGTDAMSQKELGSLVGSIPAQKKLVILDTCNAGKGGKELQIALLQQTRGLTESTAVKLLQRSIGSAVFSASSDSQQALEGYKGHGLFTYVLLEGLQGKADIKKDGYITVLGLADYIEENVIKLSEEVFKRQQTPTIQTGANFPIGKVK